jgi:sugar/nucleoside kinase (ribokinase family)
MIDAEQFEERAAGGADCILIEGMQCGNAAFMERAAALCAERKKPLALLCATPYGAERVAAFLGNLARTGRFLAETPEDEPTVFVFANRREGAIVDGAARVLPNCVYIQTDGAEGGAVRLPKAFSAADDGGEFLRFDAARPPALVLDETGAGDVFAGVFLALWFQRGVSPPSRGEIQNICARAAEAAAAVTTVPLCDVSVVKA